MAEWLLRNDFAPVIGHRFTFNTAWGGVMNCQVLAIEPHCSLSYTWDFDNDDAAYALESFVCFRPTPTAKGTHSGSNRRASAPTRKQAYGGARAGWREFWKSSKVWWGGGLGARAAAPGAWHEVANKDEKSCVAGHRNHPSRIARRAEWSPGRPGG